MLRTEGNIWTSPALSSFESAGVELAVGLVIRPLSEALGALDGGWRREV